MNEVYRGAGRILVWLGPDDKGDAPFAKEMVDHLHDVFQDEEAHGEFRVAHSEQLYRQDHVRWVPFSRLTRLPWVSLHCPLQPPSDSSKAAVYRALNKTT
jgi:hypothetical protein